jgi:hypothetical protein
MQKKDELRDAANNAALVLERKRMILSNYPEVSLYRYSHTFIDQERKAVQHRK